MINDLTKLMEASRFSLGAFKGNRRDVYKQELRKLFADPSPEAREGTYNCFELDLYYDFRSYGEKAIRLLSAIIMTDIICLTIFSQDKLTEYHSMNDKAKPWMYDHFQTRYKERLTHLLSLDPAPDEEWLLNDLFDWPQVPQTDPLEFAPERIKPLAEQFLARFPRHGGEALSYFFDHLPRDIAIDLVLDLEVEDAALAWLRLELVGLALSYETANAEEVDLPGYWIACQWDFPYSQFWPRTSGGACISDDYLAGLWFRSALDIGLTPAQMIMEHMILTRKGTIELVRPENAMPYVVLHDAEDYRTALEATFAAYDPAQPIEARYDRAFAAMDAVPLPSTGQPVAPPAATVSKAPRPDRGSKGLLPLVLVALTCVGLAVALLFVKW
ncbi:hypothetical protein [Thioclava sp. GXIMD4215]|uniref:hypothetical protein n=1 Tax=Thioclava sp. GXIMD4215 TaxID=3131928 RepID=UPI00311AEB35